MRSPLPLIALMLFLGVIETTSTSAAEAPGTAAPAAVRAAKQKELADLQAMLKEMLGQSNSLKREANAARAQHAAAQANGKIDSHLAVASRKEAENKKLIREMTPLRSRITVLRAELGIGTPKKKMNAKKKKKK